MQFPDADNQPVGDAPAQEVYEPYTRLIPIFFKGKEYQVPENNTLLRVLQYLNSEVAYGNFCWNGDCRNCQIVIRRDNESQEVTALGCLTKAVPGLQIVRLPLGISIESPPD
jgi:2Fe-2S iron-sulfur cluster protein